MFEPFPDRYVWNLSVNLALSVGGIIGETDVACKRLRPSERNASEGRETEQFFHSWMTLADDVSASAADDLANGRRRSAGHKWGRAAVYYQTAERMQAHSFAPRKQAYRRALESFAEFVKLTNEPVEFVEVPHGDTAFPALLVCAPGPAPCVIFWNGLDSTKEQIYGSGVAQELLARGISSLIVDTPGSGEALRLRGLTATIETEQWAASCVDFLESRTDIDHTRIGLTAWSLGGYYGPRAVAFEKRLRFGVAWGSNYDWGEVQRKRLANEGDRPVPHYWEHVRWVWGCGTTDEFMELADSINLRDVADQISVPFLVVHGLRDRQIPVAYAHALYDDLSSSPRPELRIFDDSEGGVEHCSVDNMAVVRDYICEWIEDEVRQITNLDNGLPTVKVGGAR